MSEKEILELIEKDAWMMNVLKIAERQISCKEDV